ncbi:uncharacterized protein G2W53_018182 [Senna tora]|uniref:Uncharacterized protein n=1 Tax=Senna tora TaxID=362788 RepID=A0A834TRJ1_9FABA|nr:uncharacterized protein G2W53_018182 [Senna tora]
MKKREEERLIGRIKEGWLFGFRSRVRVKRKNGRGIGHSLVIYRVGEGAVVREERDGSCVMERERKKYTEQQTVVSESADHVCTTPLF